MYDGMYGSTFEPNHICNYCNHKFFLHSYQEQRCTKCHDDDIKPINKVDKIDFYSDDPYGIKKKSKK